MLDLAAPPQPAQAPTPAEAVPPAAGPVGPDAAARAAGRVHLLRLEHLAVGAVDLLGRAGVDSLLLKGPVTSTWLYGDPEGRAYRDIDLLVDPDALPQARAALAAAGFEDLHAGMLAIHRPTHERTWGRGGLLLDVHTRLAGIPRGSAQPAFDALWVGRATFDLQGRTLPVLGEDARAMHLALHAAQSRGDARALSDLRRGLSQLQHETWLRAHRLALDLGCAGAFTLGLRALPEGARLAHALGADTPPALDVLLRARGASMEAQSLSEVLWRGSPSAILDAVSSLVLPLPTHRVPARTVASATARALLGLGEITGAAWATRHARKS